MDESRKQFEAWFNNHSNWKITSGMRINGGYIENPSAQQKWECWQASRAAIEIQTPDIVGDDDNSLTEYDEGYNRGIILCDNAIIKHGLKVKVNG